MQPQTKKLIYGILIGIAISLAIFFLISPTPIAFAIGCVAGVYFARPAGIWLGALVGAIVATPLGIYFTAVTWGATATPTAPRAGPIAGLEDLLALLLFGGLYGFVFVWLTKRMSRGQNSAS
jgi:hypothetical protein